jgi:hypothetical protein
MSELLVSVARAKSVVVRKISTIKIETIIEPRF